MIDYDKLLEIVSIHLGQALNEIEKCKDLDSDCAHLHQIIREVYLDLISRVEDKDD